MKKTPFLFLLLLVQISADAQCDAQADSLLQKKQFFLLNDYTKSQIHQRDAASQYYNAFTRNFFNQPTESNRSIKNLLTEHAKQLTTLQHVRLLKLRMDNDIRSFQYRKAYETADKLLHDYRTELGPDEADDIANTSIILKGLRSVKPQRLTIPQNLRIPYKKDLAKLIVVPVAFDNYSDEYVFDTGANFSVITISNARKAKLRLLRDSFQVTAITGIKVYAHIGIAANFRMGDLLISNAVFLVFPDAALSFAEGRYLIQGIIGFPIIEQMREVHIQKDGFIEIPSVPHTTALQNFGIDDLTPVVNLGVNGRMLPFTFDTGAQSTIFNAPFYLDYKTMIESEGREDSTQVGSAGGSTMLRTYQIPKVNVSLNGKPAELTNVSIKTKAESGLDGFYYGNLGQDFFSQFDELIINFIDMYVDVIKTKSTVTPLTPSHN